MLYHSWATVESKELRPLYIRSPTYDLLVTSLDALPLMSYIRSPTYDLLVTSLEALPLMTYRRLEEAKATVQKESNLWSSGY